MDYDARTLTMKTSNWIPLTQPVHRIIESIAIAIDDLGITIPRNCHAVIPSKTLSEAIRRQCLTVPGLSWEEKDDSGRFVFDSRIGKE